MIDRCMRTVSSSCDLRSRVIQLGSKLHESFLTHLSTIQVSLNIQQWHCFVDRDLKHLFVILQRSQWSYNCKCVFSHGYHSQQINFNTYMFSISVMARNACLSANLIIQKFKYIWYVLYVTQIIIYLLLC